MPIFTIEADGNAVAVLYAENEDNAQKVIESPRLKNLWVILRAIKGTSELTARNASAQETLKWNESVAAAIKTGRLSGPDEAEEENHVAFLVPIDSPMDREADHDGDDDDGE